MTTAFVGASDTASSLLKSSAALALSVCGLSFAAAMPAFAAAGHAEPGEIGLQEPVTPIAHEINFFYNDILTPIIIFISLFVLALLIYVMFKFNTKANPTPSQLTHHTGLSIIS
jgi:cytochrome c oxidase subunit 2